MGVNPKRLSRPTAAGVDVRPSSWDVIIGEVVRSAISPLGVVRPVFIGKVRDEKDVLWLFKQYDTRFSVIDTRPEATLASRIQAELAKVGVNCWRAEYNTVPSTVKIQENLLERILKLDRTLTIDDVHHALTTGMGIQLPQNFREVTQGHFAKEMTSSTRVPIRHSGRDMYDWVKSGADHALHAFNYLMVAVVRSNLLWSGAEALMGASRGQVNSGSAPAKETIETGGRGEPRKRLRIDFDKLEQGDEDDVSISFGG